MKKESLNAVKSVLEKVNRHRCCSLGAAAAAFERYEDKEKDKENAVKTDDKEQR